jgi:hypothetical protein
LFLFRGESEARILLSKQPYGSVVNIMKQRILILLMLSVGLASRFMAQAGEPILLGQSVSIAVGGTWSGAPVPPTISGMQFYIADQLPFVTVSYAGGTYLKADEAQLTSAVGGNLFLTKGQTGIFDFAATNSPGLRMFFPR